MSRVSGTYVLYFSNNSHRNRRLSIKGRRSNPHTSIYRHRKLFPTSHRLITHTFIYLKVFFYPRLDNYSKPKFTTKWFIIVQNVCIQLNFKRSLASLKIKYVRKWKSLLIKLWSLFMRLLLLLKWETSAITVRN